MFEVIEGGKGGVGAKKRKTSKERKKKKKKKERKKSVAVDDLSPLRPLCRVFDSPPALQKAGGARALDGQPYCVTVRLDESRSFPKELTSGVRAVAGQGKGFFLVPSSATLAKAGTLHVVAGFKDAAAASHVAGLCMRYAAKE